MTELTRARIAALRQELLGLEDGAGNSMDGDVNALCDLAQAYLDSKQGWIPVSERLPEVGAEHVLAAWNYGGREVLLPYAVSELSRRHSGLPYVTHWQPLPPAPPKQEDSR